MSDQIFSLQPFSQTPPSDLEIIGTVARRANVLTISYSLLGDLADVAVPPAAPPTRQSQLWEATCFEFFLGTKNDKQYWEFNLSPAGHWNVYAFNEYRQGMKEETAFPTLPFSVQTEPDALSIALKLNLGAIFAASQGLEMAIAAVVKHTPGNLSYWALKHPGKEPDFHLRDSFTLKLPA
ncbi:MAG: DOMON-like domain-containing protein [Leptolyngbyaceae cyanobacterium CSU_1_4]|nr:DOMON-like domain-containing protein [Leptolyngbyaceae cyanobacterium CSU_1_4]